MDPASISFYESMAAASATVLGIGAAVVAGRGTALAERASVLRVERGDMLNDLTVEKLKKDWYLRHREDALANLHYVASTAQTGVIRQLVAAVVLVTVCALPLSGAIEDSAWLRALVIAGFVVATYSWIKFLSRLLGSIARETRIAYLHRERRREESSEAGNPFIISGDPASLAKTSIDLIDAAMAAIREDTTIPWWRKRVQLMRLRLQRRRVMPPRPSL